MEDIAAIGKKTTRLVAVEAITAVVTSPDPDKAASLLLFPIYLCLKIFSSTTIEFDTRTPTAVDNPIKDSILKENPIACITINDEIIDVGIDKATMKVERKSCKNKKRTHPVNNTPKIRLVIVSLTDD
jgi:hypothetical protein